MSIIKGRVWKYGDNVNTDVIYPGKYLYSIVDHREMAGHALEGLDPSFIREVKPNDIIVAGKNWGCGSSREAAVVCLKEIGVGAIIAKSFARIYYRNCLNAALPAFICPDAVDEIQHGDEISIDLEAGEIRVADKIFHFPPFPEEVKEILEVGGLVAYVRKSRKSDENPHPGAN
jgi:3-isopropylmalate/(R)-2-methylmalate dehydratase small subunit